MSCRYSLKYQHTGLTRCGFRLEVTGNIVAIFIVTVPSTVQSSLSDQGKEKDQPAALNSIEPPLRSSADLYLSLDLPDNIDLSEQIDKVFQTMSIASSSVLESADTADANTSVDPSHHESIMASPSPKTFDRTLRLRFASAGIDTALPESRWVLRVLDERGEGNTFQSKKETLK